MFASISKMLSSSSSTKKPATVSNSNGNLKQRSGDSQAEDFQFIPINMDKTKKINKQDDAIGNNYLKNINAIIGAHRNGNNLKAEVTESDGPAMIRTNDRESQKAPARNKNAKAIKLKHARKPSQTSKKTVRKQSVKKKKSSKKKQSVRKKQISVKKKQTKSSSKIKAKSKKKSSKPHSKKKTKSR